MPSRLKGRNSGRASTSVHVIPDLNHWSVSSGEVGDRVQLKHDIARLGLACGTHGTIVKLCGLGMVRVRFDGDTREIAILRSHLQLHKNQRIGWKTVENSTEPPKSPGEN